MEAILRYLGFRSREEGIDDRMTCALVVSTQQKQVRRLE
jgi:hypothetical protein